MSFKKSLKSTLLFIALSVVFLVSLILFAGCADNVHYDGQFKVTYELEGGKFQNCDYLKHYYDFKENSDRRITDPEVLTKKEFVREGYKLEGWYRTKTEENGVTVYKDKWNFATDKTEGEELTLYAYWRKNIKFTYDVCYRGDDGKLEVLGSYDVNEGDVFKDLLNYASYRYGYTAIGFEDEDGNPWDTNFRHPGGEEDLTVNVVVDYIEGEFALVRTADDLKASKSENIYLLNDIDFGGGDFGGFGNYNKIFRGNGHTISNFNLTYGASRNDLVADTDLNDEGGTLCISLFGNVKNAEISDVDFRGVKVNVHTSLSTTKKIIVAPLSVKMTSSSISGVSFEGMLGCTRLPNNFDKEEKLIAVTDSACFLKDDASKVENFKCNVENNI